MDVASFSIHCVGQKCISLCKLINFFDGLLPPGVVPVLDAHFFGSTTDGNLVLGDLCDDFDDNVSLEFDRNDLLGMAGFSSCMLHSNILQIMQQYLMK
jgi:hypothetical protein